MTFPQQLTLGHGTGNDFVLGLDPDGTWNVTPTQVAALCDRRHGLGGDGLIRVVPAKYLPGQLPDASDTMWTMDYRNADGSIAEMCGNGVRVCVAFLLAHGLVGETDLAGPGVPIATRGGVKRVWREAQTGLLTVDMGPARFDSAEFDDYSGAQDAATSADPTADAAAKVITVADRPDQPTRPAYFVDMGNPHLVAVRWADQDHVAPVASLDLAQLPIVNGTPYPDANIEFVDLPLTTDQSRPQIGTPDPGTPANATSSGDTCDNNSDDSLTEEIAVTMRVYERGVGETQSCGTGAVASAVVASLATGRNGRWRLNVPGGYVVVNVTDGGAHTTLGGAAVLVADVTLTADWQQSLQAL